MRYPYTLQLRDARMAKWTPFPQDAVDTRARRLSAGAGDQEWECGDYEIATHPLLPIRVPTHDKANHTPARVE
ncbi:hypothetical protein GJ744_003987 [Endocarpon pusillum]|uniref:Uncharacterized protein n=1 Tax=Endocarpon pusillum TaxID=364733 RepID=A0A8H7E1S4_9EURO|nr:hypothetical protein GJ744_003987 [Endocarpon pusillum]